MIYKIIIGLSDIKNIAKSHSYTHNDNILFEIYCDKFVDFKLKNHKDNYEIIIKHKLYGMPYVEIFEDEITSKTEIVTLFNKVLINIKK